jgi:hypothetical protein
VAKSAAKRRTVYSRLVISGNGGHEKLGVRNKDSVKVLVSRPAGMTDPETQLSWGVRRISGWGHRQGLSDNMGATL